VCVLPLQRSVEMFVFYLSREFLCCEKSLHVCVTFLERCCSVWGSLERDIKVWMWLYLKRCSSVSVATHCNTLRYTAIHCNTLRHITTHCNTLQHNATHCNTLQHTTTHCTTLQHTATHCNTLQHTATHCNTLQQHTATHCKCECGSL